jgi:hypothetical protein
MTLQTDASFSGLGAVLTQGDEGSEKVTAYARRALSEAGGGGGGKSQVYFKSLVT